MRSSCDSNHDALSFKLGNFSEPDIDYLIANDLTNRGIYFNFEDPEQSCELFS